MPLLLLLFFQQIVDVGATWLLPLTLLLLLL
jgi:hypothetical protein